MLAYYHVEHSTHFTEITNKFRINIPIKAAVAIWSRVLRCDFSTSGLWFRYFYNHDSFTTLYSFTFYFGLL